jgi:glycerate kinase
LGFALIHLGAERVEGIDTVIKIVRFDDCLSDADLVITGEGCLDDQTLHGKVVMGVASRAARLGIPCVVLAGEVRLGKREISNVGIDSAYAMKDLVGREASWTQPAHSLQALAARVAKTWGRR